MNDSNRYGAVIHHQGGGEIVRRRRTPHAAARSGDCYLTGTVVLTALIDGGWSARVTGVIKNSLPRAVQIADRLPDVSRCRRREKTLLLHRAGSQPARVGGSHEPQHPCRGYIFLPRRHETTKKAL